MIRSFTMLFSLIVILCNISANAGNFNSQALAVGSRYHTKAAEFGGVEFDDGDWSYALAYEYRSDASYWQLGAMWSPEASLNDDIKDVITPFMNLMFYEQYFEAGIGISDPYVRYDEADDDWGDFTTQFIIGLYIPLGNFNIKVDAYLPVDDWNIFSDFKFDEFEFGAWLNFTF